MRMKDEANQSKESTTNSSQQVTFADDYEVEALFNNAIFSHETDSESEPTDTEPTENVSEDDIQCEICDSDKETQRATKKYSVHPALQTQEEDTTHPTLELSNATENMTIQRIQQLATAATKNCLPSPPL